jgi:hypothetical protein
VARTYQAELQVSLHDAPNPLDPIGATDWGETRASAFVPVEVAMIDEVVSRDRGASIVATRAIGTGGVWALFVDRWGAAKPVFWAPLHDELAAGLAYELPAGRDHLTIGDSFAVRNVAKTVASRMTSARRAT